MSSAYAPFGWLQGRRWGSRGLAGSGLRPGGRRPGISLPWYPAKLRVGQMPAEPYRRRGKGGRRGRHLSGPGEIFNHDL